MGVPDPDAQAREHGFSEQHPIRWHAQDELHGVAEAGARCHRCRWDGRRWQHRPRKQGERDARATEDKEAGAPAEVLGEIPGGAAADNHPDVGSDLDEAHRPRSCRGGVIRRDQGDRRREKQALGETQPEAQRQEHRVTGREAHQRGDRAPGDQASGDELRARDAVAEISGEG